MGRGVHEQGLHVLIVSVFQFEISSALKYLDGGHIEGNKILRSTWGLLASTGWQRYPCLGRALEDYQAPHAAALSAHP
jgi:hypothetical protein